MNKGIAYYNKHKDRMFKTFKAGISGYKAMKDEFCAELLGITPLIGAVLAKDYKAVKSMLSIVDSNEVNSADEFGRTALHYACMDDAIETIQLLLRAKANIESQGQDGVTPFLIAASSGNLSTLKYLKNQGANVFQKDYEETSALVAAYTPGYDDVVAWLKTECHLVPTEQDQKAIRETEGTRSFVRALQHKSNSDFVTDLVTPLDKATERKPDLLDQAHNAFCGLRSGAVPPRKRIRREHKQRRAGSVEQSVTNTDGENHVRFAVPKPAETPTRNIDRVMAVTGKEQTRLPHSPDFVVRILRHLERLEKPD